MEETRRTEEKKKLWRILLRRFNRAFYPLARKSFTDSGKPLDGAFEAFTAGRGLSLCAEKPVRDEVVRKYVSFRLALASLRAEEMLAETEEDRRKLRSRLDFDIPRSFTDVFGGQLKAVALYRQPFDGEAANRSLLALIGEEAGCSLGGAADFFRKETELYEAAVREEILRYKASFDMVAPDFRTAEDGDIPETLLCCFMEDLGRSYGNVLCESAAVMEPLSQACFALFEGRKKKETYLFLYRFLVFRVYAAAYFASYLWNDRELLNSFRDGALNAEPILHCIRGGVVRDFLTTEELAVDRELYRAMAEFMAQWKMFDPEDGERYYRPVPYFPMAVSEKLEKKSFERTAEKLYAGLMPAWKDNLTRREKYFLNGELRAFLNNLSRSLYFSHDMTFRTAADFVSDRYRPREEKKSKSWLRGLVKLFGR